LDKPTNALSWGRRPAVFTKLIELTQRLFEDRSGETINWAAGMAAHWGKAAVPLGSQIVSR